MGTGNGALLVGLACRGHRHLTGSDYSAASVDLAAAVLEKHGLSTSARLVVSIGCTAFYSVGIVVSLLLISAKARHSVACGSLVRATTHGAPRYIAHSTTVRMHVWCYCEAVVPARGSVDLMLTVTQDM